jgi:MFS family permease
MTPAFGPILSGWLAEASSWSAVLYVNVPLSALILILGALWLPAGKGGSSAEPDLLGMALAPVSFIGVVFGLQSLADNGLSFAGIAALAVGGASFLAFARQELSCPNPILRLDLFRSASFSFAVFLQAASVFIVPGFLFLMPMFLQNVHGWSAMAAGALMLPTALASAVGMPLGGKAYDRHGAGMVVIVGFSCATAGMILFWLLSGEASALRTILPFCLTGFGLGFYSTSLTANVLKKAPLEHAENASTINSSVMQLVNAAAITLTTAMLTIFARFGGGAAKTHTSALIAIIALAVAITALMSVRTTRKARKV